jgi:hypothetical protein
MSFDTEKLIVRTRSIPTAGAVWAISGVQPRIVRRSEKDIVFEFPHEAEPSLQAFLRAKQTIDRMLEEGV